MFVGSLLLGAGTLTDISLALFVGISVGAFSSIFIAAPVLTVLQDNREATKEHNQEVLKYRKRSETKTSADSSTGEQNKGSKAVKAGQIEGSPGRHLGQKAQPRRKK